MIEHFEDEALPQVSTSEPDHAPNTAIASNAVPSVRMAASWNRRRCSGERPNPKAAGIR